MEILFDKHMKLLDFLAQKRVSGDFNDLDQAISDATDRTSLMGVPRVKIIGLGVRPVACDLLWSYGWHAVRLGRYLPILRFSRDPLIFHTTETLDLFGVDSWS